MWAKVGFLCLSFLCFAAFLKAKRDNRARAFLALFSVLFALGIWGFFYLGTPDRGEVDFWDPDYRQVQKSLKAYILDFDEEWGLFFKDLTSGKTWGLNEDLLVPAASTVKLPLVLYASHLVSSGTLSWDRRLLYVAEDDWQPGAGSLQYKASTGDMFSVRELADLAIVESDNIAWKMLEGHLGRENIARFMRSVGGENVYPGGQNISTPKDLARYMEAALEFSKRDLNGERLIYNLSHSEWNTGINGLIKDEVLVGHKEGDVAGVANDVGVVYAKRPYILAVMSKGHEDVEAGFKKIAKISKVIYENQKRLQKKAAPGEGRR